jgi:hypothetical protein
MPITADTIAAKFPAELIGQRQWCVYRNDNGIPKMPFQARNPKYRLDNTKPEQFATFLEAVACFQNPANHMDGVGYVFVEGYLGLDLDKCLTDKTLLPSEKALSIIKGMPRTYTECSPSGEGLHYYWRCQFVVRPGVPIECHLPGLKGAEVYTQERYFTVTGDEYTALSRGLSDLSDDEAKTLVARVKALKPNNQNSPTVEVVSRHNELNKFGFKLYKAGASPEEVEDAIRAHNNRFSEPKDEKQIKRILKDLARDAQRGKITPDEEIDPDSWRDGSKSFGQLSAKPREFALSQLVPMKALTYLCGASFNGKTWVALAWGLAMATGKPWLRFYPPASLGPIKCIYHVPEMDEALVREYMYQLKFEAQIDSNILNPENFLVRPMESLLWSLKDPRMLRSSEGRVVFLDTAGYFNPTDDTNSYSQVIEFAKLIQNMLQNGALAVVGLYHPPKYANNPNEIWTLENSVLGSAGYGGLLRSCIRVKNLNADLNDKKVWLYCQGMKNPGLHPFQLQGPPPLKMKLYPSPYLSTLQSANDPRAEEIFKGFAEGKSTRALQKEHHISPNKLAVLRKQWELLQKAAAEEAANTNMQAKFEPEEDFVGEKQ